MKILLLTSAIYFLMTSISYCQLNDSTFMANRENKSKKNDFDLNLKTNFVYVFSDDQNSFAAIGLIGEVQNNLTNRTSLLLTINPTFWNESDNYPKKVLLISAGPKFYFEKNKPDFRGYFSICAGLMTAGKKTGVLFSLLPAIGFEYKINKSIGISIEVKPVLSLAPLLSMSTGLILNL